VNTIRLGSNPFEARGEYGGEGRESGPVEETVERVKSYGFFGSRSEQSVLESALEAFLDDARVGRRIWWRSRVVEATPAPGDAGGDHASSPAAVGEGARVGVVTELGVGVCPNRPEGFGHSWRSARDDSRRSCQFCGRPGRDNTPIGGVHDSGGFFAEATASRSETVGGLNTRRELTDAQKARAAEIVADKKRRDAEAVEAGTARPGQIAGARGARS
jgi:hypothetical protein